MFARGFATALAVVILSAAFLLTGPASAGVITPTPIDNRNGVLLFADHQGYNPSHLTIEQQKARQENRKRLIEQLQEQRRMKVEQLLLLQQQQNLIEQRLQRQTLQTRQLQLKSRQPKEEEDTKRKKLESEQLSGQTQTAQRNEQPKTVRKLQKSQQVQSIKEKYPALQRYYESLARRILRSQKDRLAIPKPPPPRP